MSSFRRRLIMMQGKPEDIDWDYEWSYLSGELPYDLRFIKSKTDNVYMTEEGLKFDGTNASLWLEDHRNIMLYIKLVIYYITGNSSRGYSVMLFGGQNDGTKLESEYLFTCKDETLSRRFMDIGSTAPSNNNIYGNYTYGVETDATVFMDFSDFTKGFVIYNGKKTYKKALKGMWFGSKSKIGTDNGIYGGEGYVLVKELKFKSLDKPVAVETVDGETIPVQTLYDYELEGQVQDELYEENGKTYLRKNIVEMTLSTSTIKPLNWHFPTSLDRYLSSDTNVQSVTWQDKNAYFHIVPKNGLTYRGHSGTVPIPDRHIFIYCPDASTRQFFRCGTIDGFYTDEEIAEILSGSTVRIAPNIEDQIKTYEVKRIIYLQP